MKKLILTFVFCIILSSFVFAAPPTQININQDIGVAIFTPPREYLPQNEGYAFHVHVSNISNGRPLNNTDVDCFLHLYYPNGSHSLETSLNKDSNGEDHDIFISGTNFSILGDHAYYIWCDSAEAGDTGGSASGIYIITLTGTELTEGKSILLVGLLAILVFVFVGNLIALPFVPKGDNKSEDGQLLSINNLKHLKLPLMLSAYVLFMAIIYVASNISFAFLSTTLIATLLFKLYTVMMILLLPIVIITFLYLITSLLSENEVKKLLDRGVELGGGDI